MADEAYDILTATEAVFPACLFQLTIMTPHEKKLLLALLAIFAVGALVRECRRSGLTAPQPLPALGDPQP
jgi:hypothetical protein